MRKIYEGIKKIARIYAIILSDKLEYAHGSVFCFILAVGYYITRQVRREFVVCKFLLTFSQ